MSATSATVVSMERQYHDMDYNLKHLIQINLEESTGKMLPIDEIVIEGKTVYQVIPAKHDKSSTVKKRIRPLNYEELLIHQGLENIKMSLTYIKVKCR